MKQYLITARQQIGFNGVPCKTLTIWERELPFICVLITFNAVWQENLQSGKITQANMNIHDELGARNHDQVAGKVKLTRELTI